jgi:hypothetical protein
MTSKKTSTFQDEEIVHLLKTTDLTSEDIGKRYGLSASAVTRRGVKAGVNMKHRGTVTGGHKRRREKARAQDRLSHIPDSMTGDGLSLQWLSKEWKSCTA